MRPRQEGQAGGASPKRTFQRRKVCKFCADRDITIDYKDIATLRHFVTERGKIIPMRISGNCSKHQRAVAGAIKQARAIALLPFSHKHGHM